jgi:hypothetical protein
MLQGNLNASVGEIAYKTRIPKCTVLDSIWLRLHYSARNGQLVPHALTEAQRREYVAQSTAPLSVLAKAKGRAWQVIITGGESWFFYYLPHSKIWISPDADTPEVPKRLINIPKMMITIFWNSVASMFWPHPSKRHHLTQKTSLIMC